MNNLFVYFNSPVLLANFACAKEPLTSEKYGGVNGQNGVIVQDDASSTKCLVHLARKWAHNLERI
jgi:hypothetical protein